MRPWTTVSCIVPKSLEAIDLTKVGAPALRQCAGVQHCDGSIHTGSPALSISGCINKDEGLWGGSTVGRGGLGSAERPVACRYSSRLCCNHCCLQIGQAGAAVPRDSTLGGNSDIQGTASHIHSRGSWVAVCGALLDLDAGLPIENDAGPRNGSWAWRLGYGLGCTCRGSTRWSVHSCCCTGQPNSASFALWPGSLSMLRHAHSLRWCWGEQL